MRYFNNTIELDYKKLDEGECLYDDIDLEANDIVDAQYRSVAGYEGNPDVCALPCARDIDTIKQGNYYIPPELISFRRRKQLPQSKADWMSLIAAQRRIRLPFTYHEELEVTICALLKEVYAARKIAIETHHVQIDYEEQSMSLKYQSMTPQIIPSPPGFCLLATSGHGKSAALELVSKQIPKAIRHDGYIQIPILYLTAFGNRNVTELLRSAARKIDQILDTGSAYQKQMQKIKNSAGVAELLIKWIQTFHIGMIIIDEIQYLEFGKSSDSGSGPNTFANIIHVTEETGIALGVVGNIDAMTHWGSVLRDMRRLEMHKIYVDDLNKNKEMTESYVTTFWKYQVFTESVPLTVAIRDTLVAECHGSIDLLVLLIMAVEYEALFSDSKVTINAEFIKKIAKKRFSKMQGLIDQDNSTADKEYCNARADIEEEIKNAYSELQRAEKMRSITQYLGLNDKVDRCEEIQYIWDRIHECHPDVTQNKVQKAYDMLTKRSQEFSTLSQKKKVPYVLQYVQAAKDGQKRRTEKLEVLLQDIEKATKK